MGQFNAIVSHCFRVSDGLKMSWTLVFSERSRNGPYASGFYGDDESTAVVETKAWWDGAEVLVVQNALGTRESLRTARVPSTDERTLGAVTATSQTPWDSRFLVSVYKVEAVDPSPSGCVARTSLGTAARMATKVHDETCKAVFDAFPVKDHAVEDPSKVLGM